MTHRILIVDDDAGVCELLEAGLRKKGFDVSWRTSGQEAFDLVRAEDFEVVVTDLTMRGVSGLDLCARIVEDRPDVPVIVITAFGSLDSATAAIRAGAYDFVTKPFELDALKLTLERALKHRALREEVKRLRRHVDGLQRHESIVGESPSMRRIIDVVARVGDSDTTVLLTGEGGTGKELIARAMHQGSARARGPFVPVSATSAPEPILERELFGHARDAFADARTARTGLFLRANGGTLYLDDVIDLPMTLQAKLVRALEERAVQPVGSDERLPFDARIIAATRGDIESAVEERRFREDLYYLLNVVRIDLPPLRSRGADVLLLAQRFVQQFASSKGRAVQGISPAAADKLLAYSWPGNVRELSGSIERAVALARYDQIAVDDLPDKIRNYRRSQVLVSSDDPAELVSMDELERSYIARVLEVCGGNKTHAAQILGFDRATLYRKLDRYAIRGAAGPGSER